MIELSEAEESSVEVDNFEAWFRGQKVAESKNYFWGIYLRFIEMPKPYKNPGGGMDTFNVDNS